MYHIYWQWVSKYGEILSCNVVDFESILGVAVNFTLYCTKEKLLKKYHGEQLRGCRHWQRMETLAITLEDDNCNILEYECVTPNDYVDYVETIAVKEV